MKTFIIAWYNGSETRYVDDIFNPTKGTAHEDSAQTFDSKDEADNYISEHNYYNCYVVELD